MKGKSFQSTIFLFSLFGVLTSGCAAQKSSVAANSDVLTTGTHTNTGFSDTTSTTSGTTTSSTTSNDTATTVTSTSTSTTSTNPALKFPIALVGYTGTTFTVSTINTLKVRFIPGKNSVITSNTSLAQRGIGYTTYSALAVFINVEGTEQATPLLSNGVGTTSGTATESGVIDFSNAFTNSCASTDTTCRNTVTIKVYKPNYDFWQYSYGIYCFEPTNAASYCADHTQVDSGNEWEGTLMVQTNDSGSV